MSLQKIRRLEAILRDNTDLARPLAYEAFFTDGASIWAQGLNGDAGAGVIEVVGRYPKQYVWAKSIETFAEEIRFQNPGGRAVAWSPTPYVDLDPPYPVWCSSRERDTYPGQDD